jgi:hypothetical protein
VGKYGNSVQFVTRQNVASEMHVFSAVTFAAGGILLLFEDFSKICQE